MSSNIPIDPPTSPAPPADPIVEDLIQAFAATTGMAVSVVRDFVASVECRGLLPTPAEVAAALAKFEHDINSGRIVLCSQKARRGYSRAIDRKESRQRKQITGPRKLRSKKDRSRAEAWLKEKRRAS